MASELWLLEVDSDTGNFSVSVRLDTLENIIAGFATAVESGKVSHHFSETRHSWSVVSDAWGAWDKVVFSGEPRPEDAGMYDSEPMTEFGVWLLGPKGEYYSGCGGFGMFTAKPMPGTLPQGVPLMTHWDLD